MPHPVFSLPCNCLEISLNFFQSCVDKNASTAWCVGDKKNVEKGSMPSYLNWRQWQLKLKLQKLHRILFPRWQTKTEFESWDCIIPILDSVHRSAVTLEFILRCFDCYNQKKRKKEEEKKERKGKNALQAKWHLPNHISAEMLYKQALLYTFLSNLLSYLLVL